MPDNERPGVYTSYEVSSAVGTSGNGGVIGIAALADTGTEAQKYVIDSYAEAVSTFGSGSNMAKLIKILFMNGASSVRAVPAAVGETAPTSTQYAAAFSVIMDDEDVKIMVCDSQTAGVHAAMLSAINGADESKMFRIGVVEPAQMSAADAVSAAAALNSERMVLCAPAALTSAGTADVPGSVAAAVAGAISGETDPALPLNGAALSGISGLAASYSDSNINTLVRGGVTPVENSGGVISVVRGITTRTTTAGASDTTWRELTTTLIVDDVIPTIRNSLRSRFARVKNTAQTRGAIRTQVIIELEEKMRREIIDSYDSVTVAADSSDPTVCNVDFNFTVAHGLNQIHLSAHITV